MRLFLSHGAVRRSVAQVLLCMLALLGGPAVANAEELPRFVTQNGRHALLVDGAPYTILAAQLHNSSAWPAVLPQALDQVVALHANTVEAPVYWEQFEPAPGRFDTTNVDALIAGARKRGLRVALLWFGSWKNGQMHYVPEWIKRDDATYPRMRDANGEPVDVLSPHVAANVQADARAFTALMQHLRKVDGDRHTVIVVQVENEPGAIGTVRDHGPAGEAAFAQPVPAAIAAALGKPAGSWQQLFGAEAAEAFNAHATAAYIEQVAAAGKRAYPLPLYVNTWLRYKGKRYPGMDYPSGGATVNVFALWRAATPSIDFIGTDIYTSDYGEYTKVIGQYARPDNPAWVSETGFEAATAPYLFHVLGQGGIGFSVFGIDGNPDSEANRAAIAAHAANFRQLAPLQRLIAQANLDGRLQAVAEQPGCRSARCVSVTGRPRCRLARRCGAMRRPSCRATTIMPAGCWWRSWGRRSSWSPVPQRGLNFSAARPIPAMGSCCRWSRAGMSTGAGRWSASSTATRPTTGSISAAPMRLANRRRYCGCGWAATERVGLRIGPQ